MTLLGWGAVLVAVILLIALTTVLVRAYGAANAEGGTGVPETSWLTAAPSPSATATPTATPTPEPAASTPAPATDAEAPAPESATVPGDAVAPEEKVPVALTESSAVVPEVIFSLGALESVDGEAQGPGEVAGPALRFELTVRNDTAAAVSLSATVVNLYAGAEQLPSTDLAEPGGVPLPDTVKPGQSATGTFVFAVPREARNPVKITVDYSAGIPVVVFEGQAPA